MGYFGGQTFVDGSTPINASVMNPIATALVNSVPRTGPTSTDIIDYLQHGSTDLGISSVTHAVVLDSAINILLKHNNIWNGTNDVFVVTESFPAYQLTTSGAGIACRKSNANATAGSVITWLGFTILFS